MSCIICHHHRVCVHIKSLFINSSRPWVHYYMYFLYTRSIDFCTVVHDDIVHLSCSFYLFYTFKLRSSRSQSNIWKIVTKPLAIKLYILQKTRHCPMVTIKSGAHELRIYFISMSMLTFYMLMPDLKPLFNITKNDDNNNN